MKLLFWLALAASAYASNPTPPFKDCIEHWAKVVSIPELRALMNHPEIEPLEDPEVDVRKRADGSYIVEIFQNFPLVSTYQRSIYTPKPEGGFTVDTKAQVMEATEDKVIAEVNETTHSDRAPTRSLAGERRERKAATLAALMVIHDLQHIFGIAGKQAWDTAYGLVKSPSVPAEQRHACAAAYLIAQSPLAARHIASAVAQDGITRDQLAAHLAGTREFVPKPEDRVDRIYSEVLSALKTLRRNGLSQTADEAVGKWLKQSRTTPP